MRAVRTRRGAQRYSGGFWEWLAPIGYLAVGLAAVLLLVGALPRAGHVVPVPPRADGAEVRRLIEENEALGEAWRRSLDSLCNDERLQEEDIAPDCERGTITFGDHLFDDSQPVQLTEEGIQKLHVAIHAMLRSLRESELVWQNLESIELRGHADPTARRDPYLTNMRASQRRPMAIMFYLTSDWALGERDRRDLERLLVLSAASYSRPPETCPERTRECYPYWRRVEIIPRLRESAILTRMDRIADGARTLLPPEDAARADATR